MKNNTKKAVKAKKASKTTARTIGNPPPLMQMPYKPMKKGK